MQRNLDLCRQILLDVEGLTPKAELKNKQYENYDDTVILEHVRLLTEGGLIESEIVSDSYYLIKRLTWDGHEFLKDAKNEANWKRVTQAGGSLSFHVIKTLLAQLAKDFAEKQIGIN